LESAAAARKRMVVVGIAFSGRLVPIMVLAGTTRL